MESRESRATGADQGQDDTTTITNTSNTCHEVHLEVPLYVKGATKEENLAYKRFLDYMEEKRLEARLRLDADEEKKDRAKKAEERWHLLRECTEYLEENAEGWRQRKIKEVERIREEEKTDRLTIVKLKKMRYGISRLNKAENSRLKLRAEERILKARARENL